MSRALVVASRAPAGRRQHSSPGASWEVTAIDSGEAAAPELEAAGWRCGPHGRAPWRGWSWW